MDGYLTDHQRSTGIGHSPARCTWHHAIIAFVLLASACSGSGDAAAPDTTTSTPSTTGAHPVGSSTTIPCPTVETGTSTREFEGMDRDIFVAAPDMLVERTPVLLLLHGILADPVEFAATTGLDALAPRNGIVLVAPAATGDLSAWEILPGDTDDPDYAGPNDLGFLRELVEDLRTNPCIGDLWVAGMSAGSGMAAMLMCSSHGDIAGVMFASGLAPPICPAETIPTMLVTHGTDDTVVSYEGGGQDIDGTSFALTSVVESVAGWAEMAGCAPGSETTPAPDIVIESYDDCRPGSQVQLFTVIGGGHTWPGGSADQTPTPPPVNTTFDASCVIVHRMTAGGDGIDQCIGTRSE